jgi:transcriptional regulator with XRE-family HTH domain
MAEVAAEWGFLMLGLTPEQCRAARGLLDWTQEDLAKRAGVSRSTVRDYEKGRHVLHRTSAAQIVLALEKAGAVLIPADGLGPGVRLLREPAAAQEF